MKKKLFFIILGLAIAGGCTWYIFNGGTTTTESDQTDTTNSESSQTDTTAEKDSLAVVIKKQKDSKIFNELLNSAGLADSIQSSGSYTILMPTDDAFKALPDGVLDSLKKPDNKDMLTAVLNYHIVKGSLTLNNLQNAQKLPTINGKEVIVNTKDGDTSFVSAKGDIAKVKKSDISASNGTIHIISGVLLPQ